MNNSKLYYVRIIFDIDAPINAIQQSSKQNQKAKPLPLHEAKELAGRAMGGSKFAIGYMLEEEN